MIGHEAEAEDFDRVLRFRGGEQVEERRVVAVLIEDRSATGPANMVGMARNLSAWNARHGKSTARQTGAWTQEKVALYLGNEIIHATTEYEPGRDRPT